MRTHSIWVFNWLLRAILWFLSLMNWFNVSFQVCVLWGRIITEWKYACVQILFCQSKSNWVLVWFLLFMNCFNVIFQVLLLWNRVITNGLYSFWTFIPLFSLDFYSLFYLDFYFPFLFGLFFNSFSILFWFFFMSFTFFFDFL